MNSQSKYLYWTLFFPKEEFCDSAIPARAQARNATVMHRFMNFFLTKTLENAGFMVVKNAGKSNEQSLQGKVYAGPRPDFFLVVSDSLSRRMKSICRSSGFTLMTFTYTLSPKRYFFPL